MFCFGCPSWRYQAIYSSLFYPAKQTRLVPRFHLLKPEYVHHRIKELQRSFRLRLLVCHIDVEDVVEPLGQVIKAALLNEVTLICGWTPEVR